ncbi:8163_t:CDS:2 [Cetraspora pellucida]|uniref:8163_t:CDS:1 n=1 Tax=Cetraspora pellucida TaxID=1433469 RepID=A0A9N9N7W2_9GLOM|nr:8163_t:CDS:2 [Cetraspora pellucida]
MVEKQASVLHSAYLADDIWYEVFRLLHTEVGDHLRNCLLVSSQFFRNAIPFFWKEVQILYFEQLQKFVNVLTSPNQTLPYASYIRDLRIVARTNRISSRSRSFDLASLLLKLTSIDTSWRLVAFTLELDWRDCHESLTLTDYFAKFGDSLEQVELHGSSPFLSDALSFSIGQYCLNLKKLTLESRYFHGYGIMNIAERCALTELTIWCRQVTSTTVITLTIKNCDLDDKPLLKTIDLLKNDKMNDYNIPLLPKLKSFSYVQSCTFNSGNKFTSTGLIRLLEAFPNLTDLTVITSNSSSIVNDASIKNIIHKLEKLEDINIRNAYNDQLPFHHLDNFDLTLEGLAAAIAKRPQVRLRVGAFDSMVS